MALPRILQRVEKLGYRVGCYHDIHTTPLTDQIVDSRYSAPGLRRSDPSKLVSQQPLAVSSRDASSSLPRWYVLPKPSLSVNALTI